MLKEGWDVRNVTTIVGYGRIQQKQYPPGTDIGTRIETDDREEEVSEKVSVVGTDAFMEFVESIQSEGVELERASMGKGRLPKTPMIVEVDKNNANKDLDKLDIQIPMLTSADRS